MVRRRGMCLLIVCSMALGAFSVPIPAHAVAGVDPLCVDAARSYFLTAVGTPGTSEQWSVTSDPLGHVRFGASPSGPFLDTLLVTITYAQNSFGQVGFIGYGVAPGSTLLEASNPDGVFASLQIDVDTVSAVTVSDLDDIDLPANPNTGGGLRKETDVDVADATAGTPVPASGAFADARTIKVKATLENVSPDFPVYFRAFDMDDPATDTIIDPNGASGGDNLGGLAQVLAPTSSSAADGTATTEVRLTTQPGDNIKVVATCDPFAFNDMFVSGLGFVYNTGAPLEDEDGIPSDMVTTWRRVHIETDTMAPVDGNEITASVVSAVFRNGKTKVTLGSAVDSLGDPIDLSAQADAGEFEGGRLTIGGTPFPIVASRGSLITVQGSVPAVAAGSTAVLVDDDDLNGGGPDGDDGTAIPAADLGRLSGGSSTAPSNVLAQAYVIPFYDIGGGQIPFAVNSPSDTRTIYQYAWSAHDNDPNFWTAYLLGAYQPARGNDGDPDSDRQIILGVTDLANTGSVIFYETIRDRADPSLGVCNTAAITAHEVTHQFLSTGRTEDLRNDGNGGLMSGACEAGTDTLAPVTIRGIRSAPHP